MVAETSSETVSVKSKFTVIKSKKGIGNAIGYLTNLSTTVSTNADGTKMVADENGTEADLSYSVNGGYFLVTVGQLDLRTETDTKFSFDGTNFSNGPSQTKSSLTMTITGTGISKGFYSLSGTGWSSDFESFTIWARVGNDTAKTYGLVDNDTDTVTVRQTYTIRKDKTASGNSGTSGTSGTDGTSGSAGKSADSGSSGTTGTDGTSGKRWKAPTKSAMR